MHIDSILSDCGNDFKKYDYETQISIIENLSEDIKHINDLTFSKLELLYNEEIMQGECLENFCILINHVIYNHYEEICSIEFYEKAISPNIFEIIYTERTIIPFITKFSNYITKENLMQLIEIYNGCYPLAKTAIENQAIQIANKYNDITFISNVEFLLSLKGY